MSVLADMLRTALDVLFSCICGYAVDTIGSSIMIGKMQKNQIIIQHILSLFVIVRDVQTAVTLSQLFDHWQGLYQITCY